ncbi:MULTISPECIES: DUF4268 domain-containing protein [Chitinophagaceae]
MYSREEKVRIKQAFWTAFGQYMKGVPIVDEEGKKKNWLNYKTGVRSIRFKTDATDKKGYIAIELLHKDEDERFLVWEQLLSVKKLLDEALQEAWTWERDYYDEWEKRYSRVFLELPAVNVFRQEDWPALISFFKPRILALDTFWDNVKPVFEDFL